MEEIKEGDVVQLKSGGPKMTVDEVKNGYARCVFFDSNEKHTHNDIKLTSLKPCKEVDYDYNSPS